MSRSHGTRQNLSSRFVPIKREEDEYDDTPTLRRSRRTVKQEQQADEPGGDSPSSLKQEEIDGKSSKRRRSKVDKVDHPRSSQVGATKTRERKNTSGPPTNKGPAKKRSKANPYGLTPGQSPFPDWSAPSAAACEKVAGLLGALHGNVKVPKEVPAPSLEVSGCGEVPSILDALIRTLLSANTTSKNSSTAFQGLVKRFGVLEEGIGKGSVNWNKLRLAPLDHVVSAIKHGGLAKVKGNNIKKILDMVHQENQLRREAYLAERETGQAAEIVGAQGKTASQKDLEILKADSDVLSLDHMHGMSPEQAMLELTKFPGIGVKTSSCVILFCMQQPSFAVDTHVWRLCKWLGWVPPTATRDQTFSHCEVRIPNHLKYPLHKLFVQHGRTCGRCRAITKEASEGWAEVECPIERLVERTGKTNDKASAGELSQRKRKRSDDSSSSEEPQFSDHESDNLANSD